METAEYFRKAIWDYLKGKPRGAQTRLAENSGITRIHLNDFLAGRRAMKEPLRFQITNYLECDYLDFLKRGKALLEGKPLSPDPTSRPFICMTRDEVQSKNIDTDVFIPIPYHKSGGADAFVRGKAFDIYEEVRDFVMVYAPGLPGRASHNLRAIDVLGDSMEPTIPQDAIIIIDLDDREFINDKIYAVNKDDYGIDLINIKRVKSDWENKVLLLVPDNKKYQVVIPEMEWFQLCIGRVFWVWHEL